MNPPTLFQVIEFARVAHNGQCRRDNITPYFNHVEDVAKRLEAESDDVKIVAFLHDTIEDTSVTIADLVYIGIPPNLVMAISLLTKRNNTDYDHYLYLVKSDPIATKVKIADMLSNLSDKPSRQQILKYAKGLIYLLT